MTVLALALAATPALALDGQVGVGLTFDHRGVRPFAGINGGVSDRSGVYEGSWISGPGAAGAAGAAGAGLPGGAPAAGAPAGGGAAAGSIGGTLGGAVGGAAGLTLR